MLEELRTGDGRAVAADARVARRRGVLLHRALRHGDLALVRRGGRGVPARCTCAPSRRSPSCPTARTRTSAPPSTRRSARARTCSRRCASTTARQISYNNLLDLDAARTLARDLRAAGLRDRQAQQPVRRGGRRDALGRLPRARSRATRSAPSAASSRSTARSTARRRRRSPSSSSRSCSRPATRTARSRSLDGQAERAAARGPGAPRAAARRAARSARSTGGLLVQDRDIVGEGRDRDGRRHRAPADRAEWGDLLFAWRVCAHVSSNAIVLARDRATVGIGAGQMSRVDSVRLAVEKAAGPTCRAPRWPPTRSSRSPTGPSSRSRRASRRSSSRAARCATARSIAAAEEAGVAMVFTGRRHFRH